MKTKRVIAFITMLVMSITVMSSCADNAEQPEQSPGTTTSSTYVRTTITTGYDDVRTTTETAAAKMKIPKKVEQIALSGYHSAYVTENGTLYTWGRNDGGQLGNDTYENSSKPIKIIDNVTQVALGGEHSACITKDGSLYTWGDNHIWGQLGNGESGEDENGFLAYEKLPIKIMDNVKQVALYDDYSACITEDGSLYTWGKNDYGQLGNGESGRDENGDDLFETLPVKIMDNVKQISLGYEHSACITEDRSLYTWGYNRSGQLGNDTKQDSPIPIKIMDDVKQVSLGRWHSACITENGNLYTWGTNSYGALGNNTTENSSTPIKIMDNVKQVSLGDDHSACIMEDGSFYTWGSNSCGKLGNGVFSGEIDPFDEGKDSNVPIKIETLYS